MSGLSVRNLMFMKQFAVAWPERAIVLRRVALLPWRANQALLQKIEDPNLWLWYAEKAIGLGAEPQREASLAGTRKPMGVAQWERELTQILPEELRASLPTVEETVEEIEAELGVR